MNKSDLVEAVAEDAELTKKDAKKALEDILSNVGKSLARGDTVALVGFGTFSVEERKARKARNPQTGKEIQVPSKKVVRFRPGKGLAEGVEG